MTQADSALKEWLKILGPSNVVTERELLKKKETTTYPTLQKLFCILSPGDTSEIQACLKIANKFEVAVHVVSTGKNWGYGSSVPFQNGCALISLHRLNRILEYNEELAYVRVESGVTQDQLSKYLKTKGSHLWIDPTSASPETSVIGNALDRGHGMTAYADHVSKIADLEVVLPTGELLRTDYGRLPQCRTASIDTFAPGPSLNGLFSQSNLGVITQAAVWLMPQPEEVMAGFISVPDLESLTRISGIFARFRLSQIVQGGPSFSNDIRLFQSIPYPWETFGGEGAFPAEYLENLRKKHAVSHWNCNFALYGLREDVLARAKRIETELRTHSFKVQWIENKTALELKKNNLGILESYQLRVFSGMCGQLQEGTNKRPFWKKKDGTARDNPDEGNCGFIWCAFIVPFRGKDVSEAASIIENTMREYGFDPDINLKCIRERVIHIYSSIVYDREQPGFDNRAMDCQKSLYDRMAKKGFYSHRLGVHSIGELSRGDKTHRDLIQRIKTLVDPNNILSPGKTYFSGDKK